MMESHEEIERGGRNHTPTINPFIMAKDPSSKFPLCMKSPSHKDLPAPPKYHLTVPPWLFP